MRSLRALFSEEALVPTRAHRLLAALPSNVIFTTNYDCLIERALPEAGKAVDVVLDPMPRPTRRRSRHSVSLVKLHGELAHPDTLVCSDEDYLRLFEPGSRLRQRLRRALLHRPTMFIGYGMRNLDIPLLYSRFASDFQAYRQRRYLVTFDSDPHFLALWRRRALMPLVLRGGRGESCDKAVIRLLRFLV